MTRAHRISNLIGAIVPFIAFLAAIALLWNEYVGWHDLAVLALMYVITGLGITVGYHRMLTHRSFQTYKPVEYLFAFLGSMAVQGPVIAWVADHRKHHAHTDEEGDPHSPHVGHGDGVLGALHGLWYAHMGWLFDAHGRADGEKYARDLVQDRGMTLHEPPVPLDRADRPADPGRARLPAHRRDAEGRHHRPDLGRPRAHLHAPPRHLVDQLGLPLLRAPALRRRGSLDQRLLARAPVLRRVVAPQPPRVPALRRARAQVVGGRHRRRWSSAR